MASNAMTGGGVESTVYTVTLNPGLDRTLSVPEIRYNEVLRATDSRLDWGGKGFNVSRALAALGVDSKAMGFVGGAVGSMLERGLHELGIVTDFVPISGETRTNTVVAEAGSDRYIKVNEPGPAVDVEAVEALYARVDMAAREGSLWALCGSLPPGAPADVYARLTALIQGGGGRVFLDASGPALRAGCAAGPYLVKPNAEEAVEFSGVDVASIEDAKRAVQAFQLAGVQTVALSLGAAGMLFASGGKVVQARPPKLSVRTVVGVGDALLAGLIYATRLGLDCEASARWGVAAGTAAAMGQGVSVGSMNAVADIYERVECVTLA